MSAMAAASSFSSRLSWILRSGALSLMKTSVMVMSNGRAKTSIIMKAGAITVGMMRQEWGSAVPSRNGPTQETQTVIANKSARRGLNFMIRNRTRWWQEPSVLIRSQRKESR